MLYYAIKARDILNYKPHILLGKKREKEAFRIGILKIQELLEV